MKTMMATLSLSNADGTAGSQQPVNTTTNETEVPKQKASAGKRATATALNNDEMTEKKQPLNVKHNKKELPESVEKVLACAFKDNMDTMLGGAPRRGAGNVTAVRVQIECR